MAWIEDVVDKKTGKIVGYKIRYRVGRKKPSSPTYSTKAECARDLPRYAAVESSQQPLTGTSAHTTLPIAELVLRYLDYKLSKKKLKKEYYDERLGEIMRTIQIGGWMTTGDVTVRSVIDWRNNGGNARNGAYLRGMLKWAIDLDQPVDMRAYRELRPPSAPKKVIDRPSYEELTNWIESAREYGANVYAMVAACLRQGWRPVMAARMKVEDYNATDGCVILRDLKQQDGSDRRSYLFPEINFLIRDISIYRAPSQHLFLDPRTGRGWLEGKDRCAITHWWRRHIDERNKKGVYNLKYECVSHYFECGLAPSEIQAFTGHKDLRQVMTYSRTNEQQQKAAIAKVTKQEGLAGANRGQIVQQPAISPKSESHKPLSGNDAQSDASG